MMKWMFRQLKNLLKENESHFDIDSEIKLNFFIISDFFKLFVIYGVFEILIQGFTFSQILLIY